MSMQENVHVCVVLNTQNRVHFLNEYSQIHV